MRTIVALLVAAASTLLLHGVAAAADDETYVISRSWKLTYVNGDPRIVPSVEDDVIEVSCHNDDMMRDWKVNDEDLVAEAREKADGTGVQVQPEFTGKTEILRITVECEKA
ncbi:hypothetical protein K1T35_12210 [Pseudonocardia sp. DSM 110487]|jgi:hypothetical protein|uniref:hypothetical protein n=1 Tax=Pseudonocardia sp. DSM 110487 TaxID=2865833 RepID=UPI001C697FDC|nr:hypothetical protein [Pseudonocardia sp. DSM 110487]QYN37932.1 hypothetical protein K1T35_12210 [Pseudonocardia sp. DSM 110487]